MRQLLVIFTFLIGCEEPKKREQVHKDLCIHECVESILYPLEAVADGESKVYWDMCKKRFEHLRCCETSQYDYYSACKEKRMKLKP